MHHLIINPTAGKKKMHQLVEKIKSIFDKGKLEYFSFIIQFRFHFFILYYFLKRGYLTLGEISSLSFYNFLPTIFSSTFVSIKNSSIFWIRNQLILTFLAQAAPKRQAESGQEFFQINSFLPKLPLDTNYARHKHACHKQRSPHK